MLCISLWTIACALFLYPLGATLFWHLRYGATISYSGQSFTVPVRWTAWVHDGSIFFVKRPITVFPEDAFVAWSTARPMSRQSQVGRDREDNYGSFSAVFQTKLVSDGEIVEDSVLLGSGADEAMCIQATRQSHHTWLHSGCIFFDSTWTSDFRGSVSDRDTFLYTILGLPVTPRRAYPR
jgi:hypothetical protein